MSAAIQAAYRLKRGVLRLLRWPTTGVKAIVFDARGDVLLIRNRYGRTDLWVLPGGGVKRGEPPHHAAVREVMEETGCTLASVERIAVLRSAAEGKRDTIHLFRATTRDTPAADSIEVADARFVALNDLPATTSPATRRRLDELSGIRHATGIW